MLLTTAKYALIALTVALVGAVTPHAAATDTCIVVDQDDQTCVRAASYGYGSCDDRGYEGNAVSVSRSSWEDGTYSGAGVSTWCDQFSYADNETFYESGNHGLSARADVAPGVGADAQWYAYEWSSTWGSGTECALGAEALGVRVTSPCFAGQPPRVPVLLP